MGLIFSPRFSTFSLTHHPAMKPTMNPIVKNIRCSLLCFYNWCRVISDHEPNAYHYDDCNTNHYLLVFLYFVYYFFHCTPSLKVIHIYRILAIHFLLFFAFLEWAVVWVEHATQCVYYALEICRLGIILP